MKHLQLKDFSSDNYRLRVEKPDKDFSPRRNYHVISQVLAENDRMQTQVHEDVVKNAGNVADILANFAKYKLDIGGEKQIEEYLGRGWMTKIYGDKLIEKIRNREALQRLNIKKGNDKFKNYYLT